MANLSNNCNDKCMVEQDINRLLAYLEETKDNEPFIMKRIDEDNRFYVKQDCNGYQMVSLVYPASNVCSEDYNSKGYKRICYKGKKRLKHRLIYKCFGVIPEWADFDNMVVHHINGNILDNRIENLYLISKPNHAILHKYIDKYGINNVEL